MTCTTGLSGCSITLNVLGLHYLAFPLALAGRPDRKGLAGPWDPVVRVGP